MIRVLTGSFVAMILVAVAGAQPLPTLSVSANPPAVQAGGVVTLTVSFTDTTPSGNVSGAQWTISPTTNLTIGTATAAASSIANLKSLAYNGVNGVFLVLGDDPKTLNNTAMTSGALATIPITIASGAPSGSLPIVLSNILGTSPAGIGVNLTGTNTTVMVLPNPADLNGDGVVNVSDIGPAINQFLGVAPCTNGDLNGDHVCNLLDVQLEVNAIVKALSGH